MKPPPTTLQGLREPPGQGPLGEGSALPRTGRGGGRADPTQIPPTPAGLLRRNKWSQKFNPGFYIFLYFKIVLLSYI